MKSTQILSSIISTKHVLPPQTHHVAPVVSVIIPVLNEEILVERTLRVFARLRELYPIEIIVSDGGSTDATLAIAECYADCIVQHTAPHKQTIAEGRNRGAERARGDVVVFINGDTVPAYPDQFMMAVLTWSAHGHAREYAIACPVHIAPDERVLADRLFHGAYNWYVRALNRIGFGMGRGECQVLRKHDFMRVGGYNQTLVAGEDFDLYRRVRTAGNIGWNSDMLVFESPRRFRKYGYGYVLRTWTANALAVMLTGKAISQYWEEVR
jgi:glycosyltransferase involved in cell wall biosynthesis